ncbi:hypothetical protein LOTGIDRAFT_154674 [Lottia gigantea]|uniref:Uncharacterized protein n=1 Tax=Lottia gigantea TaxID=225164 RepID=V3ZS36_LOTGI|nr:hypothetical protein LOTGIDRAFT_154674 [Lottia gigantea]ESO87172.1 hypothetical protein LOTGIDRAFT_154674 [Lottia gigantea]
MTVDSTAGILGKVSEISFTAFNVFDTVQNSGETCLISDECWRKMTKLGYNGYSLTHEVFYLQIGKQFGCKKEMERKLKEYNQESVENLEDIFCTVILSEANKYSQDHFPHYKHDLFMEQAALCGMLGYRQFFNTPWLLAILSWQDPRYGCYRAASDEILLKEDGHRIKREERRLKNQCLSHRTTVAVAALGQYVRYILETWADNQKINH